MENFIEINMYIHPLTEPIIYYYTRPYLRASVEEPMPSGERMLLLRAEWIWLKVGLSVLSFCQQSSIS